MKFGYGWIRNESLSVAEIMQLNIIYSGYMRDEHETKCSQPNLSKSLEIFLEKPKC
jgi:hypothetical protein